MRGLPVRLGARLRGAAWLGLSQLAFVVSGYVLNLVLARRFGPDRFGAYSVVITILSAVNLTQTQGVPQALARAVAERPDRAPAAFTAAVRLQRLATVAGTLSLAALAAPAGLLLHDRRVGWGLLVAALAVPGYAAVATWTGYLNGLHAFRRQAALMTWYSLLRVVVVIGLALAFGLLGAVAAFAVVPPLVVLLLARRGPQAAPGEPSLPLRPLVGFSLTSIGFSLAVTGTMSVDLLLVKGLVDDGRAAGVYAAAQNGARIPYYLLLPAGAVLFPAVAGVLAHGGLVEARRVVRDGVEGAAAVVLPVAAVLAGAGGPLLELVFGSAYRGTGAPLALLAPALALLAVAFTLASVARGAGLSRPPMLAALLALLLGVVVGVPLTLAVGVRGAAASTLLAAAACLVAQGALLHRRLGSFLDPSRLGRLALAATAAYLVARLASSPASSLPAAAGALLVDVALVVVLRVVPAALRPAPTAPSA